LTLLELIEPVCQYVCRLNRTARKGGHFEQIQVRAELSGLFDEALSKSNSDPVLANQMDKTKGKIEWILAFFVDSMIRESSLSFAGEWRDFAEERYDELSGDEKFWDLLDEVLAERGESADERLAVYYSMMGLGFTGWYTGQPEYLRKKMLECSARLRSQIDSDENSRIINESELYQNTADLIEPPGKSLFGILVAAAILIVVLLVGNIYLYRSNTVNLRGSLETIIGVQTLHQDNNSPAVDSEAPKE